MWYSLCWWLAVRMKARCWWHWPELAGCTCRLCKSLAETWTPSHTSKCPPPPEWQAWQPKESGQEFSPRTESVYLVLPPAKPQLGRAPWVRRATEQRPLNNTDLLLAPEKMASSAPSLHVDTVCQMYNTQRVFFKKPAPYQPLFSSSATTGRHRIKCT